MKNPLTVLLFILSLSVVGADTAEEQSSASAKAEEPRKLYVVYGVNADDYLPDRQAAGAEVQSEKTALHRRNGLPLNNVPESFFFLMIPVFVGLLLFVVGLFIHDMEREDKIILEEELGSMNPKP